jgi:type III secretory pathway component EscS
VDPALLHVAREALLVVLVVSAPPLGAALAVGLVVGVLQAATQVQEPSVAVVPRLAAVIATLAVAAPFAGARLLRLAQAAFDLLPRVAP